MKGMEVNLHREVAVVQCSILNWKNHGYYQRFTIEMDGKEEELS